jgi:hypothetical protein
VQQRLEVRRQPGSSVTNRQPRGLELLKRPGEVWVPGASVPGDADRSTGSYIG